MSFEMKYDPQGRVIKQPDLEAQLNAAAESTHVEVSQAEPVREEVSPPEPLAETMEVLEDESTTEPEDDIEKPKKLGAPSPKNTTYKNNFTILREKAELAERRAQQAEQLLERYNTQKSESVDEDLSYSIDDDSLVEGKHLSKVEKKIQRLENQLKQYQQQSTINTVESKLKSQYPDFDSVVSGENLANLKAAYPEIAHTINSSSDLYNKAVSAYTMIKKLGISEPVDTYQADKEVAKRNAAKPRPMTSISPQQGDSPLTKANAFATGGKLTEDMKAQLWKEVNQYRG